MILPVQPSMAITEGAADRAVVDAIEHKAALIVGEPNDELLLLIGAGPDQFLGDRL